MAIPSVNDLMLPVLKMLADGEPHHVDEAVIMAQQEFNLTPAELREKLKSGNYVINNRIDWVRAHFTKHKLAENLGEGWFRILPCGQQVLAQAPQDLSVTFLKSLTCGD